MNRARCVFIPTELSEQEWTAIATSSTDYNLLQSWPYAEAKAATGPWKIIRGIIQRDGQKVGLAQTLIRSVPLGMGGLAWLNRGPLRLGPQAEDRATLCEMLAAVQKYFVDQQGYYLRIAPPVSRDILELKAAEIPDFGITDATGWASARLDLSIPEDQLRRTLHGKWRNALSRAERADIQVSEGVGPQLFQFFLKGHKEHLAKLGPHGGLPEIFLNALNNRLSGEDRLETFIACIEERPVGGIIIAKYGKTAEYLAGHNTDEGRVSNVGQLLLWRAVCSFQERGVTCFDLGGMDPVLTPEGIFRFKQRTGAQPYQYINELESGARGLINRLVRRRIMKARGGQ